MLGADDALWTRWFGDADQAKAGFQEDRRPWSKEAMQSLTAGNERKVVLVRCTEVGTIRLDDDERVRVATTTGTETPMMVRRRRLARTPDSTLIRHQQTHWSIIKL